MTTQQPSRDEFISYWKDVDAPFRLRDLASEGIYIGGLAIIAVVARLSVPSDSSLLLWMIAAGAYLTLVPSIFLPYFSSGEPDLFIVRIVMPILEKSDIGKLLSEQDAARSVGSKCYEIFVCDDAVRLDEKADARHNDMPVIQSACENDNSNSVRCSHFTSCHC